MIKRRSPPHAAIERSYLLPLFLCLGALLAMRIAGLMAGRMDLVFDEAQYWTWSRELAFGYYSKPPMVAWVIRVATELCGDGEACVRSASPVLYTITSLILYATAKELFDARVGFWSAIVFATLPGLSYSSNLITTDVPLLLFWTAAFYFWVMLVKRQEMRFAVLLGVAAGLGLLSKQATIYFLLCVGCHALVSQEARDAMKQGRGPVALLIAFVMASPMLIWNAANDFITFRHTAANVGWKFPFVHPLAMLDYIVVQFGVFGPILMVVLLRTTGREFAHRSDQRKALLLAFSLPVLALLLVQSLLSRAHGNWSGVAYPAATILVTSVMIELGRRRLFQISLGLHLAVAGVLAAAPAFAPRLAELGQPRSNPLVRVLGWRELAAATEELAETYGAKGILTDDREATAELLYYLRNVPLPLSVWPRGPKPHNHFEMTRAYTPSAPQPLLYVTLHHAPRAIMEHFGTVTLVGEQHFPTVTPARTARFYILTEPQRKRQ